MSDQLWLCDLKTRYHPLLTSVEYFIKLLIIPGQQLVLWTCVLMPSSPVTWNLSLLQWNMNYYMQWWGYLLIVFHILILAIAVYIPFVSVMSEWRGLYICIIRLYYDVLPCVVRLISSPHPCLSLHHYIVVSMSSNTLVLVNVLYICRMLLIFHSIETTSNISKVLCIYTYKSIFQSILHNRFVQCICGSVCNNYLKLAAQLMQTYWNMNIYSISFIIRDFLVHCIHFSMMRKWCQGQVGTVWLVYH